MSYKSKEGNKLKNIIYKVVSINYSDKNLAQKEVNKLKNSNINSFISTVKKGSEIYYILVVGNYKDKNNTNKQLNLLKSKG